MLILIGGLIDCPGIGQDGAIGSSGLFGLGNPYAKLLQKGSLNLFRMDAFLVVPACPSSLELSAQNMRNHGKEGVSMETSYELATFAGGCFWCMVKPFDQWEGVKHVVSGYTGGHKENPTYEEVCSHTTGHLEAVQITFDPNVISYSTLLDIFWRQIDPTDPGGQFYDRGESYKTAIFYHNEEQRMLAEASKSALEQSGRFDKPIVTEIRPAGPFYPAEEYHQDFYKKNPEHYYRYARASGREAFKQRVWGTSE